MKKIITTLLFTSCSFFLLRAQTVSTFENIALPADSFFNGRYHSGGFASGNAFFVNHYDTSFGGVWDGFAVSSKTDSVTPGYGNQYSAIAGKGFNGSANYAVVYASGFAVSLPRVRLTGVATGKQLSGMYVTNSAYTYYSMKNGDAFSKKFGGASGNDPDWFRLKVYGFKNGGNPADSVLSFYLADFRDSVNTNDYILKGWQWVDLSPLGNVDSIEFELTSSDTGAFGMNTPGYFCIDHFTTRDMYTSVVKAEIAAMDVVIYPNPFRRKLTINLDSEEEAQVILSDLSGRTVWSGYGRKEIAADLDGLSGGIYMVRIFCDGQVLTRKLVKE